MLWIKVQRKGRRIVSAFVQGEGDNHQDPFVETRNDWKTIHAAEAVAKALGSAYIATDSGPYVSPRYDVIRRPQVGDKVTYAFNGDYYPCGEITAISNSLRIVTATETAEGKPTKVRKFYRRGATGVWKYNRTWSMVIGHISKLNPEF